MENEKAEPGDTILIVDPESWVNGRKYLVVERPKDVDKNHSGFNYPWVIEPSYSVNDRPVCISGKYKIIESRKAQTAPNDVDERMRQQKDDNLRSVFT